MTEVFQKVPIKVSKGNSPLGGFCFSGPPENQSLQIFFNQNNYERRLTMRRIITTAVICFAFSAFGLQSNILAEDVIPCNVEPTDQIIQYGNFLDGPNCKISVGDMDVFRFEGRQNEKIIVKATDQSGSNSIVACITLLDPDGIPTPKAVEGIGLTASADR